jgi:hypothetical protein
MMGIHAADLAAWQVIEFWEGRDEDLPAVLRAVADYIDRLQVMASVKDIVYHFDDEERVPIIRLTIEHDPYTYGPLPSPL